MCGWEASTAILVASSNTKIAFYVSKFKLDLKVTNFKNVQ